MKGCLGFFVSAFLWIVFWGSCIGIGEQFKIDPFLVLIILSVGIFFVLILGFRLYQYIFDRYKNRVDFIKKKYPNSCQMFIKKNQMEKDSFTGEIKKLSDLIKISVHSDSFWENEENLYIEEQNRKNKEYNEKFDKAKEKAEWIKKEYPEGYEKWSETLRNNPFIEPVLAIAKYEENIAALDKHIKSEKWEKAQSDFSDICYELSKKHLPDYGRYEYDIPFTKFDDNGKEIPGTYKVWQLFYSSMCLRALDYTNCPRYKTNAEKVPEFENGTMHLKPHVYKDIAEFIKEIADYYCKDNNDKISVIFNYEKDWGKEVLDSHYKPLEKLLSDNAKINCDDTSLYDNDYWIDGFDKINVIVDIVTENDDMKRICQHIISLNPNFKPVIVYISLMKAYDREEMIKIIDKENERIAKIKEEKEKEEKAKKNLIESVSQWDTLFGGLKYSYLLYYYPTTCEFEATQKEWDNRYIVWNFKNDPGRISPSVHAKTLNIVVSMLKNKLTSTFSEESLKYITLVCIPASSQAKTKARYEEFSSKICEELGMINAYPHINVTEERLERHLGGTTTDTDKISFDNDFFNGKYVLLFDDVITRGDSMKTFKRKMESLGATVVGGLCLGRTKHERDIPSPFGF